MGPAVCALAASFLLLWPELNGGHAMADDFDGILKGIRPDKIPSHWVGSPTRSAPGYRWDDPQSTSSVRFFAGRPDDADPTKHKPFVYVVREGIVIGRDGQPIPGLTAPE